MAIPSDDTDLNTLVQELTSLFRQQGFNNKPTNPISTEYQSPIKGTFYNSGNFSPGVATDARHVKGHDGVDLRAAAGTAVYPLTSGVVTNVSTNPVGGNIINIQHPNGVRSYYAHLSTVNVYKGDKVNNDTIIGTVGNTGNAKVTWPHLHFQVWENNRLQNPSKFFSVPPYTNVDKSKEQWWASEESKKNTELFSMKKHLESRKAAFTQGVNKLSKIAEIYYSLFIKA